MIFIYNVIQLLLLLFLSPIIVIIFLCKPKTRNKIRSRIQPPAFPRSKNDTTRKTIWVHALSVGEVTSSVPLIKAIKNTFPNIIIFFSTATKTGNTTAKELLGKEVNHFFTSPLDLYPVVKAYFTRINPDLYIQVETDFWPNQLHILKQSSIPSLLVNGRISAHSFQSYKQLKFFTKRMFSNFSILSMQTDRDRQRMIELGLPSNKVIALGNLKFDYQLSKEAITSKDHGLLLADNRKCFIAGSTHPGEEPIILDALNMLREKNQSIQTIIAPRDITRKTNIAELCRERQFSVCFKTENNSSPTDIIILDTLGELNSLYRLSEIAFIGGSLVDEGGHNPIEPALFETPVLFGTHMEDFNEISEGMVNYGGAQIVKNSSELYNQLLSFLEDDSLRIQSGKKAKEFVMMHQGAVYAHIEYIKSLW